MHVAYTVRPRCAVKASAYIRVGDCRFTAKTFRGKLGSVGEMGDCRGKNERRIRNGSIHLRIACQDHDQPTL